MLLIDVPLQSEAKNNTILLSLSTSTSFCETMEHNLMEIPTHSLAFSTLQSTPPPTHPPLHFFFILKILFIEGEVEVREETTPNEFLINFFFFFRGDRTPPLLPGGSIVCATVSGSVV